MKTLSLNKKEAELVLSMLKYSREIDVEALGDTYNSPEDVIMLANNIILGANIITKLKETK